MWHLHSYLMLASASKSWGFKTVAFQTFDVKDYVKRYGYPLFEATSQLLEHQMESLPIIHA